MSVPFAVSTSFPWPHCGDRKVAARRLTFRGRSSYVQNFTGSPVRFGDEALQNDTADGVPCYGVAVRGVVKAEGIGDTYRTPRMRVCLSPAFS